jgi:hypothetical protein
MMNRTASFLLLFFLGNAFCINAQQSVYIAPGGTLYTHGSAQMAIFGDVINDVAGGLNHNNGGTVYLYRSVSNGSGNTRVYDGPLAPSPTDNYNTGGAYVRFYNLVTDNTTGTATPSGTLINTTNGGGQIQVEQELRISNQHTFTNGMIWTPRGNWKHAFVHYDANGATYTGNTNARHIDGYAAKTGSSDFDFPIGDGIYQRISGISSPASGMYKSAYFNKNPQSGTTGISGSSASTSPLNGGLVKISSREFWDIDGTAASQYKLTALNSVAGYSDWTNDFLTFVTSNLQIVAWDGMWENLSINTAPASLGSDGPFISTASPTNPDAGNSYGTNLPFSAYTWGVSVFPIPLSVRLISFTATADKCAAHLTWNTTNEINIDRYEVEKSENGVSYSLAGQVSAQNGTGLNTYTIKIEQQHKSEYYRIKTMGKDGTYSYSPVQQVHTNCIAPANSFNVYPNPVCYGQAFINFTAEKTSMASLILFNMMGQQAMKKDIIVNQGNNNLLLMINNLPKGTYVIKLSSANGDIGNKTQKIIVQ